MVAETTNLPEVDAPIGMDNDDDDLREFVESSISLIEGHLEHNHGEAHRLTDVEQSVDEVLSHENIRKVDIRARPLENPKVTVWLSDCPIWANDSWRETFYPFGINDYNGKVTATMDVRPF